MRGSEEEKTINEMALERAGGGEKIRRWAKLNKEEEEKEKD